jgi:hypothetical protein
MKEHFLYEKITNKETAPNMKTSHHVQGKQPTANNKKEVDEKGF